MKDEDQEYDPIFDALDSLDKELSVIEKELLLYDLNQLALRGKGALTYHYVRLFLEFDSPHLFLNHKCPMVLVLKPHKELRPLH